MKASVLTGQVINVKVHHAWRMLCYMVEIYGVIFSLVLWNHILGNVLVILSCPLIIQKTLGSVTH